MVCPGRKKGAPLAFQACYEKAIQYHEQKMWLAALPYYGAMLELTERSLGLFHPQVGNALEAISTCYRMIGRIDDAIQCLQRIVLVRELNNDGSPEKNKEAFATAGLLSELYIQAGNLSLAKELLFKTEQIARSAFGESSFERGRALCAYSGCLELNSEHLESERALREAISLDGYINSTISSEKFAASNALYNLGVLLFDRQRFLESIPYFQKSLELKVASGLPIPESDRTEIERFIEACESNHQLQSSGLPIPPANAEESTLPLPPAVASTEVA